MNKGLTSLDISEKNLDRDKEQLTKKTKQFSM